MNIAIIGSGNVGSALAHAWTKAGHSVVIAARDPRAEKYRAFAADGMAVAATREAVAGAQAVLLATPWSATEDALRGAGDLSGKILIDATNPLAPDLSGLTHAGNTSGGEQVAAWAPGAKVVKAFNTIGSASMTNPVFGDHAAVMPVAGDDAEARAVVAGLASDIGFDPVEAGGLAMARTLEPLALLWITLAYPRGMGQNIGFALLRR